MYLPVGSSIKLFSAMNNLLKAFKSLKANLGIVSKRLLLKSKSSKFSKLFSRVSGKLLILFLDKCSRIKFGVPSNILGGNILIILSEASNV